MRAEATAWQLETRGQKATVEFRSATAEARDEAGGQPEAAGPPLRGTDTETRIRSESPSIQAESNEWLSVAVSTDHDHISASNARGERHDREADEAQRAAAEAAILTATIELHEEKPLCEVTAEAIAERAGTPSTRPTRTARGDNEVPVGKAIAGRQNLARFDTLQASYPDCSARP